jgi:hypothetical protein
MSGQKIMNKWINNIKAIIVVLVFCLIQSKLTAQNCGAPNSAPNINYEVVAGASSSDFFPICVNVKFHIVRQSNGTGGIPSTAIQTMVDNLNTAFNPQNIYLISTGFDFVNNSDLTYLQTDSEYNTLITQNVVNNAMNVYIIDGNDLGWAGRIDNIPGIKCVINSSSIFSPTLPHEIGHGFFLFHTHHSGGCGDFDGCQEEINGTNCSTCGDFVCDTPADPCVQGKIGTSCNYTGSGGFTPDVTNYMSYGGTCRNHFSAGQGAKMRISLKSHSVLLPITNSSCVSMTGSGSLCQSSPVTYTVSNAFPANSISWSIFPPGLATITTNGNSATLYPVNNANGAIALTATITTSTGILVARKDIFIGKPLSYAQEDIDSYGYLKLTKVILPVGTTATWSVNNVAVASSTKIIKCRTSGNTNYTWSVTGTNSCGTAVNSSNGILYPCGSSNRQAPEISIEILPNPSSDFVKLSVIGKEEFEDVESIIIISPFYGIISKLDTKNIDQNIDVSQHKEGIYYVVLKVKDKPNIISKSFLVHH